MSKLLAAPLLVLALLMTAVPAAAAETPSVTAQWVRAGSNLTVMVTGRSSRTASWRVDLTGTGRASGERLRVTVSATDLGFTAAFDELTRVGTSWVVRLHVDATAMLGSGTATIGVFDQRLGISVDSASLTLPRNGNRTLAVQFRGASRAARLTLQGGIRIASPDAFLFGPWLSTYPVNI